jgi:hypothetical protein
MEATAIAGELSSRGLGIRLDGDDRMTVRLRKGVLGIYMQRKF